MAEVTNLLNLPHELYLSITSYLSPHSKAQLKYTCRFLYKLIVITLTEVQTIESSLETNRPEPYAWWQWKIDREYLICSSCLRLRRTSNFALSALSDPFGIASQATPRVCIECNVHNGIQGYAIGDKIEHYQGRERVICTDCKEFPAAESDTERRMRGYCRECFDRLCTGGRLTLKGIRRLGGYDLHLHHSTKCSSCDKKYDICTGNSESLEDNIDGGRLLIGDQLQRRYTLKEVLMMVRHTVDPKGLQQLFLPLPHHTFRVCRGLIPRIMTDKAGRKWIV